MDKAFQDYYPNELSYCYGCGRLNDEGYQIKSYWEDGIAVCHFTPAPAHISIPGYVYGGLIASLIDCHGTGTAAAAAYRSENRPMDSDPPLRFVTASLQVNYLKPTPLGVELRLEGTPREVKGRKVTVDISLSARDVECASGVVVAVQVPGTMLEELTKQR